MEEMKRYRLNSVDLVEDGMLQHLNRAAFHPLGFALGVTTDPDGEIIGFYLIGNGDEPWQFPEGDNEKFVRFWAKIAELRNC